METAYAPLSEACAKALSDKTYDKRKAAALEIEKYAKCLKPTHNTATRHRLLIFTLQPNPMNSVTFTIKFCTEWSSNSTRQKTINKSKSSYWFSAEILQSLETHTNERVA